MDKWQPTGRRIITFQAHTIFFLFRCWVSCKKRSREQNHIWKDWIAVKVAQSTFLPIIAGAQFAICASLHFWGPVHWTPCKTWSRFKCKAEENFQSASALGCDFETNWKNKRCRSGTVYVNKLSCLSEKKTYFSSLQTLSLIGSSWNKMKPKFLFKSDEVFKFGMTSYFKCNLDLKFGKEWKPSRTLQLLRLTGNLQS